MQEVYSSASRVCLRTSGLGSHTMGPWQNGNFFNLPVNTKVVYYIPRSPGLPGTKTVTGNGAIGYFADGVAMFDPACADQPGGTYACFVTIAADGSPTCPSLHHRAAVLRSEGRREFQRGGDGQLHNVELPNVTNYLGGASATTMLPPAYSGVAGGQVTLKWDSIEGGRYVIESSDDLAA